MGKKRTTQHDRPSHPPNPGAPLRYVEDCFEPRTMLGIVFSRPSHKRGERRIYHRVTDEPLQPTDHHLFLQRSFIQTDLNGKARA